MPSSLPETSPARVLAPGKVYGRCTAPDGAHPERHTGPFTNERFDHVERATVSTCVNCGRKAVADCS